MNNIEVHKLKSILKAKAFTGSMEGVFNNVVIDSRKVVKDSIFIAIKGERVDGHDFIEKAFKDGASCCIGEKSYKDLGFEIEKGSYIEVEDSKEALIDIAKYYRSILPATFVGITGSVGKTGTKEFIATVLAESFKVHKTSGNFNNAIGLPLTILSAPFDTEVAVVEMGISDFGEMSVLADIARPDIMVFSNIGHCHLENLGDRKGVLKAKTEVFNFLKEGSTVVLNGDDDMLHSKENIENLESKKLKPVFFGDNNYNDIRCENVEVRDDARLSFDIDVNGKTGRVNLGIPGLHNRYNSLAAVAVGTTLKMPLDKIISGLEKTVTISGRANFIEVNDKLTVIDDCYNANVESMKAALDILSHNKNIKIAVLGDMLELGKDSEKLHREIGEYAAKSGIDYLLTNGEMAEFISEGGKDIKGRHFNSKQELIESLNEILDKEGKKTVLLKASNGMKFVEIKDVLINEK